MKKVSLLLLLCSIILAGCKDNVAGEASGAEPVLLWEKIRAADVSDVLPDGDRPQWLSEKINELEILWGKDKSIVKIGILHGEWKNQDYYVILNNLASCIFCEVYDKDGEKQVWQDENSSDSFQTASKNWKVIYLFGDALIY